MNRTVSYLAIVAIVAFLAALGGTITRAAENDVVITQRTATGQKPVVLADPGADRILFWRESVNEPRYLTLGSGLTITGTTITSSASGGTWGSITGTLSSQTDLQTALNGKLSTSGTAALATALATARTINGTAFDGTANITITSAAGTLTGSTLNSGITGSSLTSLGTITVGVWNGTPIVNAYLQNSGLTLGSTTISLGGTATTVAGLTSFSSTTFYAANSGNGYSFTGQTDTSLRNNGGSISVYVGGNASFELNRYDGFQIHRDYSLAWSNGSSNAQGTMDTFLRRNNPPAWVAMGKASATPIAQTFSGADGSGTNIVGGNLTLASGRGDRQRGQQRHRHAGCVCDRRGSGQLHHHT